MPCNPRLYIHSGFWSKEAVYHSMVPDALQFLTYLWQGKLLQLPFRRFRFPFPLSWLPREFPLQRYRYRVCLPYQLSHILPERWLCSDKFQLA